MKGKTSCASLRIPNDNERRERMRDAYHESGHATAAWLMGVPIQRISLTPHPLVDNSKFVIGQIANESDPDTLAGIALTAIAGREAELLFDASGPEHERRRDTTVARRALGCSNRFDEFYQFTELRGLAQSILSANWPLVTTLANELDRQGELTGS